MGGNGTANEIGHDQDPCSCQKPVSKSETGMVHQMASRSEKDAREDEKAEEKGLEGAGIGIASLKVGIGIAPLIGLHAVSSTQSHNQPAHRMHDPAPDPTDLLSPPIDLAPEDYSYSAFEESCD